VKQDLRAATVREAAPNAASLFASPHSLVMNSAIVADSTYVGMPD
jgi:hypothetical protein